MNNELKKKLIDFDTKTDVLWESMESIQFDNPELLDELGFDKEKLINAFNKIKNAMVNSIPAEVYGISKKENIEESVEAKMYSEYDTTNNVVDKQYYTHIFYNGKWCLASEVKE